MSYTETLVTWIYIRVRKPYDLRKRLIIYYNSSFQRDSWAFYNWRNKYLCLHNKYILTM